MNHRFRTFLLLSPSLSLSLSLSLSIYIYIYIKKACYLKYFRVYSTHLAHTDVLSPFTMSLIHFTHSDILITDAKVNIVSKIELSKAFLKLVDVK